MQPFSVLLQPEAIRPDTVVDRPLPTAQSREELAARWAEIVGKRLNAIGIRGHWQVSVIAAPADHLHLGFALRAVRTHPRVAVFEIVPSPGECPETVVRHLTGRDSSTYQITKGD